MKELIQKLKLSVREFSEMYNIPYKTVLQWRNGERKPPEYLVKLIEENIKLKTKGEQLKISDRKKYYAVYIESDIGVYRDFFSENDIKKAYKKKELYEKTIHVKKSEIECWEKVN